MALSPHSPFYCEVSSKSEALLSLRIELSMTPLNHAGWFLLQVTEKPTQWLNTWKSSLSQGSRIPGRVGSRGLQSTSQWLSGRTQGFFFHIPWLPMAVPSNLVAVILRDASSQRESRQRTSALFTTSKGVMFSSVVLSFRGNLFFSPEVPFGLLMSQNQTFIWLF